MTSALLKEVMCISVPGKVCVTMTDDRARPLRNAVINLSTSFRHDPTARDLLQDIALVLIYQQSGRGVHPKDAYNLMVRYEELTCERLKTASGI